MRFEAAPGDMGRQQQKHPLLAAFVAAGCTDVQIARHYTVDPVTIRRWRRAEGLPVGKPRRREFPHGTFTRYSSGCRCDDCRKANADAHSRQRERRRLEGLAPDDPRHGTVNAAQNFGCGCGPCSAAQRERNAAYYRTVHGGITVPRWTPEEDAVATDPSLSAVEAAERLGRTVTAVYQRRRRLRRRSWN